MPKITKFRALYTRKTIDEYQIFVRNKNKKDFILVGTEITREGAETFVTILKQSSNETLFKIIKKRKKTNDSEVS